jgi:hypothetical protein
MDPPVLQGGTKLPETLSHPLAERLTGVLVAGKKIGVV